MTINGEFIGNITVSVFKFSEGLNYYCLQADNTDICPVLDVIEDILYKY